MSEWLLTVPLWQANLVVFGFCVAFGLPLGVIAVVFGMTWEHEPYHYSCEEPFEDSDKE